MKTKIILIVSIFLASFIIKAQDLNKIRKNNTFFILIDKNDKLTKFSCSSKKSIPECRYSLFKKNKEPFKYDFLYSKYSTFDDAINNLNEAMLFTINKSFIRQNKDIIITRDFMEKMGSRKIISLLDDDSSNKTIFMINTAETKNGKILLREVEIDYVREE